MASPTVVNQAITTEASSTSHALTMPGSIVAGNLLLSLVKSGLVPTGATLGSGWSSLYTFFTNTTQGISAYGKIAAGSDTGTIAQSSATTTSAITYQISGWSGVVAGILAATVNQGSSNAVPDPPNLNMVTTNDWLIITQGAGSGSPAYTVQANYTNLQQTGSTLVSSQRALTASSENPGAYTGAILSFPQAATIAVPPAPSASSVGLLRTPLVPRMRSFNW